MTPIRVLGFYDYRGWAWWHRLRQVRRYLPGDISLDVREVYEDFPHAQYDFFLIFESYLLPHLKAVPPEKIIAGSSTRRLAEDACAACAQGKCLGLVFNSWEMYEAALAAAPGKPVWCCRNGVDAELFTPASSPPQTFTACWIGNGNSVCEKGLDIIQSACRQAGVPLLFRDQARERDTLNQEQVRDAYYHKASVYLCASRWEGTPNPALEALACGLPVISTPVGNMPEVLRDGHNGFLVERAADAFAEALGRLRDADMAALRVNARQSVLRGWTWEQQTQNYAAMFREFAAHRGLPPARAIPDGREGRDGREGQEGYRELLLRDGVKRLFAGQPGEAASSLAWAARYSPLWRAARRASHYVP